MAKEHGIDKHKDAMGKCMHRWKNHDPRPLHSGKGKKGKSGKIVTSQDQAVAVCLSITEKGGSGYSEASLAEVNELLSDFADVMIPKKGNCPRGTKGKGKWCKINRPDGEFYLEIEDGDNCPIGTRGAGKGYCVGQYAELPYEYYAEGSCPAPTPKKKRTAAQRSSDKQRSQQQAGQNPPNIPQPRQEAGLRKARKIQDRCSG